MYIFGNQYHLLDKWATTCVGWGGGRGGFSAAFHPGTRSHDHTTRDATGTFTKGYSHAKWGERDKKELKAMKDNQSLLKRNPSCYLECTVLYKRYRSLALNIGLFGGGKKKKGKKRKKVGKNVLWNKRHIHSLQSSVFATRKKVVAEARNWFIGCFSLKLSQKQNEHASSTFFFFQNSTLAAKRTSLKTRP